MRWNPKFFQLCASVAVTALLAETIMPVPLRAQPAAPPLPSSQADATPQADQNQPDPPSRVGRIAAITGTASFHGQDDTQWSPVSVNFPVSSGNAFWTEPNAQMRLEISDSLIAMAPATEFDVHTLDQAGMQGVAARGEVYLDLRNIGPDEAWIVQTPRGLVKLNGSGRYAIVVGTTDDPTLVTVIDGSASVESPNFTLTVEPNQAARLTGTDSFQGVIEPAKRDAFLVAMLGRDRPPPAKLPPQVAETITAMPGGDDLATVGSWSDAPEYGQVWYPPVDPGWVPYRHGHWAYVAPWGWTWIDDASWGFAPFHYGRWVELGGRWAWTPGVREVRERPVYAPALVAFIGLGAGVAIGAALASRSVGWVPLGPREAYHPWYHASNNYVRQVNVGHVTNVTNITTVNNVTVNNFANRGALTAVPASAMAASRPVAALARPVTPQEIATARPVFGQQPLRPTAATAGVTPSVATRLNIAPQVGGRPTAPGPVIRATAAGPQGGGPRGPGVPNGPRPATAGGPQGPIGRPSIPPAGPQGAGSPAGEQPRPGPQGPGAQRPGAPGPGVQAPGVTGPGVPAPGVPAPGVTRPGVTGLGVTGPGAQRPGPQGTGPQGPGPQGAGAQGPGSRPLGASAGQPGAPGSPLPTGAAAMRPGQPAPGAPLGHAAPTPGQPIAPHPGPAENPAAPQPHVNPPQQVAPRPAPQPAPLPHVNPPQQQFAPRPAPQPAPQPHVNPPPQQFAPRPAPQPAPQPHFNPPPQQFAPRPAPQPAPQPHFNPPPQQAAPRPAPQPAPQPHAAPAPAPHPQEHQKRPGEK